MSCINDTETINLEVTGGVLTADLILDPDPTNAAEVTSDGLFVAGPNETGWFPISDTVTYAGADDPTYYAAVVGDQTSKYQRGMRFRCTQTSYRYFVITAVAYDGGTGLTTLTLYGGTGYDLANAALVDPAYSTAKAPTGFDPNPALWTVSLDDTSDRTQASPVAGTWYNVGALSITIPVGIWEVSYQGSLRATFSSGSGSITVAATLSTGNSTEADRTFSAYAYMGTAGSYANRIGQDFHREALLALAVKTAYYANVKSVDANCSALGLYGSTGSETNIRAVCALL